MRSRLSFYPGVIIAAASCFAGGAAWATDAQNPQPNPLDWPGVQPSGFEWGYPFEIRPRVVEGTNGSSYAVSSMRTTVEGWHLKPVYRAEEGWARVIGFFVWPGESVAAGESPRALLYIRPDDPCASWSVKAFTTGTAWDAVEYVKAQYAIGPASDVFWEVPREVAGSGTGEGPVVFKDGLSVTDPMRLIADGMEWSADVTVPGPRATFLALLQDSGYSAVDVPFERKGEGNTTAFLWRQARYYERAISAGILSPGEWSQVLDWAFGADPEGPSHGQVVLAQYGPQSIPVMPDSVITLPCPPPDGLWDCPAHYTGPWYPVEELCNCTTVGPIPLPPREYVADAVGEIVIHIPFPPPIGTRITYRVSSHERVHARVCAWYRTCSAISERQTKYRLRPDCQWRWGPVHRSLQPVTYGRMFYWVTGPNDPCTPEMRPPDCPPTTEPCGLMIPIQWVP
jgi:hypothetical protein